MRALLGALLIMVALAARPIAVYPQQAGFLASNTWITYFVGGRGTGKTFVGGHKIRKMARDNDPWLVLSPDSGVATETTLPSFLQMTKGLGIYVDHKLTPYPKVWFRTQDNGVASLLFRSAEKPEKLRGGNYAGLWMDEASFIARAAFERSIATLRWNPKKMGPVLMTMTPKGRQNWTFDELFDPVDERLIGTDGCSADGLHWISGRPYRLKDNRTLVHANSLDNPFLPPDFVHNLSGSYSTRFAQQELGGEFVDIAGLMFDRTWFEFVDQAPRNATRVRYWDKACFVKGTLVATDRGNVPIESVTISDKVLTRDGYKSLSWVGVSGKTNTLCSVVFSDGSVLTGTPDHKVWCNKSRNWIALERLGSYNAVTLKNKGDRWPGQGIQNWSELRLMGESTRVTQTLRVRKNKGISIATSGRRRPRNTSIDRSIGIYGNTTTALFPMATILTTSTVTGETTNLQTSSVCHRKGIGKSTQRISRKKLRSLIQNIEKKHSRHLGSPSLKVVSMESAKNAAQNLQGNQRSGSIAQPFAGAGLTNVYDLTVKNGPPEFFANGVLVHNCTPGSGAYTAGVLIAMTENPKCWYIEDVVRGQWSYGERDKHIVATAELDAIKYDNEVIIVAEQEGGSAGKEVAHNMIVNMAGFPVFKDVVSGGKQERVKEGEKLPGEAKIRRAMLWQAQAEAGNIKLVRGKWNPDYLEEVVSFPESTIKDQVDATSGGFNRLSGRMFTVTKETPTKTTVNLDSSRFGQANSLDRRGQRKNLYGFERKSDRRS